ncbi:MAG: ribonuclease Z [Deltaproteobacteria bacterium]|nr:ribonuclease Z [Deltaproteobacteria bacterium]
MPGRRLSSVAVRVEGQLYLFDGGEGTQVPYKELHLGLRSLDLIAVSHLHADHVLGLPGLLMLRGQMPDPGPLTILGPPGLARFIRNIRADLRMHIRYPIEIKEWSKDADRLAYRDALVNIFWQPLEHSVFCLGYRMEEHQRPGRFDPDRARELGVPAGPLFGQLQRGQTITTPQGTTVEPTEVLGPTRRGRHMVFATDTIPCRSLVELLDAADIAFVESMFLPDDEEDAREKKHMTAAQAAGAAAEAKVQQLLLFHISPRYERRELKRFADIARSIHPNANVAKEGQIIAIPLPD